MNPNNIDCPTCNGEGYLSECCTAPGDTPGYHYCPECEELDFFQPCPECEGMGVTTEKYHKSYVHENKY
jgi:DnaJ-class molecular chaperone